ncbi:hypothetical protein Gohar_009090 [Gossypium harknessii]|uniref:Uncharacterized protein n=1 Tax=Gossypium harknessii TaxID=34285 RepID=A0A7J9GLQ2_9ROSI|nr:hypothetical protein [Gossypium harknessii]
MFTNLVGLASNGAPIILRATVREEKEDKGYNNCFHFLSNSILCRVDESNAINTSVTKPCPKDAICDKEKYINAKVSSWIFSIDAHTSIFIFHHPCILPHLLLSCILLMGEGNKSLQDMICCSSYRRSFPVGFFVLYAPNIISSLNQYVNKLLVSRDPMQLGVSQNSINIWQAVKADNIREVYRLITVSDTNMVNTTFDDVFSVEWYHHVDAQNSSIDIQNEHLIQNDPSACQRIKNSNDPGSCLQGCSLLHLACQRSNPVMVELLLQFGADINMRDYHGRTPLHHCIAIGKNPLAKHLLKRGARSSIRDGGGFSALDRAMEKGAITDEGLLILLSESD